MIKQQDDQYAFWVRLAAVASCSTALILVVLKLYAWLMTDASAMLASTTDSMLDLFASVMNLIIIRFALAPPDKQHKFGHGKAESLAGLIQAAFMSGSALLLLFTGINRLITPRELVHSEIAIWVTLIALVLTLLLVILQKQVIKRTQSLVISADNLHYQSDLLLNLGVLLAVVMSQALWAGADGLFTLAVGGYLLWGAGKIIYLSVYQLMDHELSDHEIVQIKTIVMQNKRALGLHELRTRRAGPTRFIQFHLELDDNLSLLDAHGIGVNIESEIKNTFDPCEVFIHHDPSSIVPGELSRDEISGA
jgi:ferrous-iron efflux pump FieF